MSKRLALLLSSVLLVAGLGAWWFLRSTGSEGPPPDEVAVAKEGGAMSRRGETPPSTQQTRASGRVFANEGGSALEGALVRLWSLDGGSTEGETSPTTAVTDASGNWSLGTVPAGRYRISASAPGYLAGALEEVRLVAEDANAGLDIGLERGGARLSGTIADATGGTVDGALVTVAPITGVYGLSAAKRVTTSSDGNGVFEMQLAPGRYQLRAWHPDYSEATRVVTMDKGDRRVDLELTPMGVLEGVVVADESSSPVPGARVLYGAEREFGGVMGESARTQTVNLGQVRADDQGRFRISGLDAGTIVLSAAAPGLSTDGATRVELSLAERRSDLELRLGLGHDLKGRVVDASDPSRGVPGARVQLEGTGELARVVESDEEGRFVVDGAQAGRYRANAWADGYLPNPEGTRIEVPTEAALELSLEPGMVIRGRVEPAQRAEVRLELDMDAMMAGGFGMMGNASSMMLNGTQTTSDEKGVFELRPAAPGQWKLVATTDAGLVGELPLEIREGDAPDVVIPLESRATVSGLVRDSLGQPAQDVSVHLRRAAGSSKMMVVINGAELGSHVGPAAEDGSYLVAGLAAGDYEVEVRDAQGNVLPWADEGGGPVGLKLGEGEERSNFDLSVVARDAEIRGRVTLATGGPAADVWVRANPQARPVPPPPSEDGEPGEGRSEMRMVMAVSDGGGGPEAGPGRGRPVLTDAEGNFVISNLASGEYTVVAERAAGAARTQKEDVKTGTRVELEMPPLGSLRVSIRQDGSPVRGGVARLSGPNNRSTTFAADGFALDGLAPGNYMLSVVAGDGGTNAEVVIEAGKETRSEVEIQRWIRIKGRVLDPDGKPLTGARVMIGQSAMPGGGPGGPGGGPGGNDGEGDGPQEMAISIESGDEADAEETDAEGRFETTVGGGPRVLVITGADSPMPLAVRPFMAQGEDIDFGDITAQQGGGMMGPPGEGGEHRGGVSIDIGGP